MDATTPPLTRAALPWLAGALCLTLAIGSGLLLAELLMSPPSSDLWELGAYLTVAGAGTLLGGWLAMATADRLLGLSIESRAFVGSLLAGGVALINVLVIAQLMFISTDHDLNVLISVIVFSAVVTAFFSLWAARTVTRRLKPITAAVRALAGGDLEARVNVAGGDQVANLAEDVNRLAQRLQEAAQRRDALNRERRELTTAISHDLRTPLASLRAMAEALDDQLVPTDEIQRYYTTMRREVERLSRMIDDLFELAQIDAGALRLNRERVCVEEIAADVVDALQPQARQAGVTLALSADGNTTASLDGARIERAIANLLRNGIEHTPEGGRVEVVVSPRPGWVDVRVADTGTGIGEDDLPRIWQRFYRAEESRNRSPRNADGAGLGLAIARGIVEAHNGGVAVESARGRGSTFTIRLPRAP